MAQAIAYEFGATSTTDEVLSGVDLGGKRILVTGVSAGLGVETARSLVAHGAQVVGAARDLTKAEAATAQVRKEAASSGGTLELVELDLANLKSVRAAADALLNEGKFLDVIIANAGIMATPFGHTADGFETQFGTNHLGHFVLVNRIAPLLRSGGRLINLSSAGHRYGNVDLNDPNFEHTPYDPFVAYPGAIQTDLLRHRSAEDLQRLIDQINQQLAAENKPPFQWKTVPQGAATSVWSAVVASSDEIGGEYCENCHVSKIVPDTATITAVTEGVRAYALDPKSAEALWKKSEEMVGEFF
jgi:hypothetical protein